MKLNFETNIAEGTPEELVEYLRLVEEGEKKSGNELFSFGHSHQPDEDTLKSLVGSLVKVADSYTDSIKLSVDEAVDEAIEEEEEETASTELQVGDKVKVLVSAGGAEGEATVTKVYATGDIEIEGKSKDGIYLTNWSSHVKFLEKIEDEDLDPEEADELLGYRYWYLSDTNNKFVVLKTTNSYLEDSRGKRYTYQAVSSHVKPIDRENASKYFERSKDRKALLKYYPTADVFTEY